MLTVGLTISVLLLAATIGLMLAGHFYTIEMVCRQSPGSVVLAGVRGGGVFVLSVSSPAPAWRSAAPRILDDWTADLAGFRFGPELPPGHWPGTPGFVVVPFWFLLAVFGACTGACLLLLKRPHARPALLPGRGFDLAAKVTVYRPPFRFLCRPRFWGAHEGETSLAPAGGRLCDCPGTRGARCPAGPGRRQRAW